LFFLCPKRWPSADAEFTGLGRTVHPSVSALAPGSLELKFGRGDKVQSSPDRAQDMIARDAVEIGLSDAIALAIRLGRLLLDFPEHPDEGRTQTDHDNQKQQRQCRGCEHVQHP
jgi:hypothetical protein